MSGGVDPAIQAELVALLPRLRRFARGLAGVPDQADDLVQAACEKALSRIHQWTPGTRLDSWMFRIVQTTWLDQKRAQKVRTLIRNDFLKAFETVDAIVSPTTPTAAFRLGEKSGDPLQMYLSDIFTISCNLAGNCGISIPCGFTREPKLPIGLQILGKPFGEPTLLRVAHAYEQRTPWSSERAPLA
jgi:Asp-tRNA(Asn)/Glu-tRNA(Gln) amidotransferase A subunit family amidase